MVDTRHTSSRHAGRGRVAAAVLAAGGLVAGCASPADDAAAPNVRETSTTAERSGDGAAGADRADGGAGDAVAGPTTSAAEATTTTAVPDATAPDTTTATPPPTTAPPATAPPTTAPPPPAAEDDGMLRLGESGDAITALQQRLTDLGYWLGEPDGSFGQLTRQAVIAFQKAEGLGRDGVAGPQTSERLAAAGRPTARTTSGDVVEIDLARQIVLIVQGGQVRYVLNTSTGNGETYVGSSGGTAVATTPAGTFTVQRRIDGVREAPLGTLYRPAYFNGGIALHGAGQVPAHPASHGCARVTNAAMDHLWADGVVDVGDTVLVY